MKALATVELYELQTEDPAAGEALLAAARSAGREDGLAGMVLGRGGHLLTVLAGPEDALGRLAGTLADAPAVRRGTRIYTGLARPGEFDRLRTAWDAQAGSFEEPFESLAAALADYAENDARSRVEVAVFFRLYLTLRETEAAHAMVTLAS